MMSDGLDNQQQNYCIIRNKHYSTNKHKVSVGNMLWDGRMYDPVVNHNPS